MTKEKMAERLDGRQYGNEMTLEDRELAGKGGLVIVFGASDDLMLFEGAVCDDVDVYKGDIAYLNENGLFRNECDDENCPYAEKEFEKCKTITAFWCPSHGGSWAYETDIPHATFKIYEGEGLYCTGIVFQLNVLTK
jgi:hypothetical protein